MRKIALVVLVAFVVMSFAQDAYALKLGDLINPIKTTKKIVKNDISFNQSFSHAYVIFHYLLIGMAKGLIKTEKKVRNKAIGLAKKQVKLDKTVAKGLFNAEKKARSKVVGLAKKQVKLDKTIAKGTWKATKKAGTFGAALGFLKTKLSRKNEGNLKVRIPEYNQNKKGKYIGPGLAVKKAKYIGPKL